MRNWVAQAVDSAVRLRVPSSNRTGTQWSAISAPTISAHEFRTFAMAVSLSQPLSVTSLSNALPRSSGSLPLRVLLIVFLADAPFVARRKSRSAAWACSCGVTSGVCLGSTFSLKENHHCEQLWSLKKCETLVQRFPLARQTPPLQ